MAAKVIVMIDVRSSNNAMADVLSVTEGNMIRAGESIESVQVVKYVSVPECVSSVYQVCSECVASV